MLTTNATHRLGRTSPLLRLSATVLTLGLLASCGGTPAEPAQSLRTVRTDAAPWALPPNPTYFIEQANMQKLPLEFVGPKPFYIRILITIDGKEIAIPAGIGIDTAKAHQAAIHTHTNDGIVLVEARKADTRFNLKTFFDLWAVRYSETCLGDSCGKIEVIVDGAKSDWNPQLEPNNFIEVKATTT